METRLLQATEIDHAADSLRSGKLVAFPTDTFFALGAVLDDDPIASLFATKGRMAGNPVPVLLSSADQVSQVAAEFPEPASVLAKRFWPGPLTLVLPTRGEVPDSVTAGTGNIGVRVPDHELAIDLISRTGRPVTGTSANLSGQDPCKTAHEVQSQLAGSIDAILDGACGDHTAPSTVVSFVGGELQIFREGSISRQTLEEALLGHV